jgi:hypothetical protein
MAALSVDVDCSFLWNAAHSSKSSARTSKLIF